MSKRMIFQCSGLTGPKKSGQTLKFWRNASSCSKFRWSTPEGTVFYFTNNTFPSSTKEWKGILHNHYLLQTSNKTSDTWSSGFGVFFSVRKREKNMKKTWKKTCLQAVSKQNTAFVLWKGRTLKQLHVASASCCAEGTEQQAFGTVLFQPEKGTSDTQKTCLVCLGILLQEKNRDIGWKAG